MSCISLPRRIGWVCGEEYASKEEPFGNNSHQALVFGSHAAVVVSRERGLWGGKNNHSSVPIPHP